MNFYLAIDAGGTKTDFLLASDTQELARVRTGTIKRMRTDELTASQNLAQALQMLTFRTGISMAQVTRTCIGTAGERVPLVADWLRTELTARIGGDLILLGDVEIALCAAFENDPGILVLAGTGSNVAGRTPDSVITTAGGWGPVLSDQGSGHRIGYEALRALFLAIDEGKSTSLLPAILDFWKLTSIDHLVEHAHSIHAPDFSALTELVLSCAEDNDEIANRVLTQQGRELAFLVQLVIRRIQHAPEHRNWIPRLAFAGSILQNVKPVREVLIAEILRDFPETTIHQSIVDPLEGALWRARTGSPNPGLTS